MIRLLPEGLQNEEELRRTCRSPQLIQAMKVLSSALNQGDGYNSIIQSFGLDPSRQIKREEKKGMKKLILQSKSGMNSLAAGDAIGAFLDALKKSIKDGENKN